MSEMKTLDQYLKQRKGRWYYVRRVPLRYVDVDTRRIIKTALKTGSREVSIPTADSFADPDGDDVTYTVSGLPEGLTIDPTTGLIFGTVAGSASQTGPYDVTVTATDAQGETAESTFTLDVTNPAPVVETPVMPVTSPVAGEEVTIDVGAASADPDGDAILTYSSDDLPPGLSLDPETGIISGAPTTPQADPYLFTIKVADGEGGVTEVTLTLQVNEDGFVEPSEYVKPVGVADNVDPYEFLEGQPIDLQRYFHDRALDARDDYGRMFGDRDFRGGMVAAHVPGMGHDCAYMVVEAVAYDHNVTVSFGSTFPMFCDASVMNWDVSMADGASLPAWVNWSNGADFMDVSRPLDTETIRLQVRALLDNGRTTSTTVEIDLRTGTVTQVGDAYAQGQTLQQQMALEAMMLRDQVAEVDTAQDALLRALAG